ncbi:hypothetical protein DPSP01_007882 [Paraphaeosphaeria sporulosa]
MMTAMTSGWFRFEGYPIKFGVLPKPPDLQEDRVFNKSEDDSSWSMVWKYMIRISTPDKPQYVNKQLPSSMHRLRASRSLETIDLDDDIKSDLIADIDRFMHESRSKWYGNRRMPYRKGSIFYGLIFYGPSWTGKTSDCQALAARFNYSLYAMSLNEAESECHLKKLFQSPQKGDILLLDDIDSAGIMRENMRGEEKMPNDKDVEVQLKKEKEVNPRISLARLLSAIDSLPDGIVLIMTNNKPESLEQALIRPGRIDKQVLFGNVSQVVAKSIFVRKHQNDSNAPGF